MKQKHFYFFLGTNAELIKVVPIMREFQKRKVPFKIITSGQNEIRFSDLKSIIGKVKPYITFEEKIHKSSMFLFILWAIKTFFTCIVTLRHEFKGLDKKNTYFIIHGDTVTSTIGALIGFFYRLTVVYIESGFLSFKMLEPF